MNRFFVFMLCAATLGCGMPKDVYYARYPEKAPENYSPNSRKDKPKKHIYDSRYSTLPTDKSLNANSGKPSNHQRNRSSNVNDISNKEHFNNDLFPSDRPDRSRNYSPDEPRKTYMNYAPPMAINRKKFVEQAKKYLGVRYTYGGSTRETGLDCSGFVMNVFNDFGIKSPRVSRDIAMYGKEVPLHKAQVGDLIFFTGRNHTSGIIGHLGIIVETGAQMKFIHSATSKNVGVIISEFKGYYKDHFVKVMSVLH